MHVEWVKGWHVKVVEAVHKNKVEKTGLKVLSSHT